MGCKERQKACRVGLGESRWREICFQGLNSYHVIGMDWTFSSSILMIYPEGQVWLCGRGLEEVQGLHYQQSSWIKQGEKIE